MIDPQGTGLGSITEAIHAAVRHIVQQGGAPWVEHMSLRAYKRRRVLYRFLDWCRDHGITDTQLLWHGVYRQRRRGTHWWPDLLHAVAWHYWQRWVPIRAQWEYVWPSALWGVPQAQPGGWWVTLSLLRRPRGYAVLTVEAAWRERDTGDRLWRQPWRWIPVMRTADETIMVSVIDRLELTIWRGW